MLFEFLNMEGLPPPTRELRIVEVTNKSSVSEGNKLRVPGNSLHTAAHYAARYDELISAGLPWLNMSCMGVYDGYLIVGIEIPQGSARRERMNTSVNFSGPLASVLEKGWDARQVLVIEW